MPTINFKVCASHVSPRFCFDNEPIRVSSSPGRDGYWYAVGTLGCSKDYSSPERAARAMFEDNCCTQIRIEPASDLDGQLLYAIHRMRD